MAASAATIDELRGSLTGLSMRAEVQTTSVTPDELVVAQHPVWFPAALVQLASFTCLTEGWNSYGAGRVALSTVRDALQLLVRFVDLGLPSPQIVPTARGGVQFEWAIGGLEFELELEPGGGMLALFDDPVRGESWERELPPNDLVPIRDALRRILQAERSG